MHEALQRTPLPPRMAFPLAACLAILSLKRIPEGQAYTIYRFGRYRRTLDSGLHWIVPLIERVAHREPGVGQIGAGLVEPPMEAFAKAVRALAGQ